MPCVTNAGIQPDLQEAVRLYRLAAGQGNTLALNNLGGLYENGLGVPKSVDEAIALYRKGAEAGSAQAVANLKRLGKL